MRSSLYVFFSKIARNSRFEFGAVHCSGEAATVWRSACNGENAGFDSLSRIISSIIVLLVVFGYPLLLIGIVELFA